MTGLFSKCASGALLPSCTWRNSVHARKMAPETGADQERWPQNDSGRMAEPCAAKLKFACKRAPGKSQLAPVDGTMLRSRCPYTTDSHRNPSRAHNRLSVALVWGLWALAVLGSWASAWALAASGSWASAWALA